MLDWILGADNTRHAFGWLFAGAVLDLFSLFFSLFLWTWRCVKKRRGPSGIPGVGLCFALPAELLYWRPLFFTGREPWIVWKLAEVGLITAYSAVCNFPITLYFIMWCFGCYREGLGEGPDGSGAALGEKPSA